MEATKKAKTEIYNLIVLDESGSMSNAVKSTIKGCNETLRTIRKAQEEFADSQDHFVSIFLFQSDTKVPSRYIVKNVPINEVNDINDEIYRPWGNTPLLDAVGSTLVDLRNAVNERPFAIGNVTIITDGYENSSHSYTYEKVSAMIDALKELGWSINFIGANIDVAHVAKNLHIDSHMSFTSDEEGTAQMFSRQNESRMRWAENARMAYEESCYDFDSVPKSRESFISKLKKAAQNYFKDDEE